MHVQELIVRSGRKHLSRQRFDNILAGLKELRFRVRNTISRDFSRYDASIDNFVTNDGISITTDDDTFIMICKDNKPLRVFTLVVSRNKPEPIPFGHLVQRGRC